MDALKQSQNTQSSGPASPEKTTLWIWPTGLFPRCLVYYFRAKNITVSTLAAHNIDLIPVTLQPPAKLDSAPGYEERPADSSLPIMRIQRQDSSIFWIRESMAIMEYFEEIFPASKGYPNLRGSKIGQRVRTRDILSIIVEANSWGLVSLIHSDPSTVFWSGLTTEEQSPSAAKHAKNKHHFYLSRLESWVEEDVIQKETISLSGQGGNVTLADILMMALVEYAEGSYGKDYIQEHGVLRVWCDRAKGQSYRVGIEELKRSEREGWEIVFGN